MLFSDRPQCYEMHCDTEGTPCVRVYIHTCNFIRYICYNAYIRAPPGPPARGGAEPLPPASHSPVAPRCSAGSTRPPPFKIALIPNGSSGCSGGSHALPKPSSRGPRVPEAPRAAAAHPEPGSEARPAPGPPTPPGRPLTAGRAAARPGRQGCSCGARPGPALRGARRPVPL